LSALLLPDNLEETETLLVRGLRRVYEPVVEFALANRIVTLGSLGVVALMAVIAVRSLGLEFLPKLEEGNFWIRATMPLSISLEEGNGYVNRMRRVILSFPEVQTAISQHGRPDDGTDATGFFNAEFFVPLKPADEWPAGVDKEKLTAQLTRALESQFPGVEFNFSQYIQDNVEEAASGVKGENSVKLYGNDLQTLESTAEKIQSVLQTVPGITDLAVLNPLGQPTIRIDIDRTRAARLGLSPGDINATLQAAIGGQAAGDLYEGGSDRHFPMIVRLSHEYRGDPEAIRRIPIGIQDPSGSGTTVQIPLGDVANVQLISGPSFIYREHQERYVPIKFSVRGRDLGSAVLEAQDKVAKEVPIPGGYSLEWVGEFGNLQDALHRLAVAVPASIALICVLLFINFGSLVDVLLAASVIPMALIGGVFALALTGTPFSVSAAIGFVALFGIATMDGIIVLSYYNLHIEGGMDRMSAILHTCRVQMRPVMMTCVVACVGLVPAAISTGIGSQVQRPLALVVVGGMLLTPILVLLVLPLLILLLSKRVVIAAVAATLAGCAAGPNFTHPAPPAVNSYLAEPLPDQTESTSVTGGDTQHLKSASEVPAQWWTEFNSPALDTLIDSAFKNSPSIQEAQAALREANENYYAQRGSLLPVVAANYSFERQRNATGTLSPTLTSGESVFNLHTAQVNVSYVLDVFGGVRRQTESLQAQAEAQKFELQATFLTLASNVVTTAIQEASLRAQLEATNDIVQSEREALQILRRQYDLGSIAMTDVMAQEAALATTEATVPGLRKQLEQSRHALATLAGQFPSQAAQEHFELTSLHLPGDLPITVPSQLVRHRPDVLAAEAQLHAASAQVGVAIANMLPQISLLGDQGGAATQFGQMFKAGNTFWAGGATLTQTLFSGGALLHKERAARAELDRAGAQYRSAVLTAFQNVADALTALDLDAQALNATLRAKNAALDSLSTVRKNVELGSVGYLALLNAQQTYQQAVLALSQAQANRYSDTVALYQALGGGW
jgi:NodT family efflux transporter outer membrane factor (OMF) lipoprotein